jgi:ketosteroid isomerase-like protein
MKKFLFLILIAMMFAPVTFAQSQTGRAQTRKSAAEFPDLVQRYYDAWNSGDLDKAGAFYAKDADLIFYDVTPLEYHGWSQYKAGVQKLLAAYSSLKLVPNSDLKSGRQGKIAWTTLTFHLVGTTKAGAKSDTVCRHTAIWEKRKGEWLVIHEHVSAPLP